MLSPLLSLSGSDHVNEIRYFAWQAKIESAWHNWAWASLEVFSPRKPSRPDHGSEKKREIWEINNLSSRSLRDVNFTNPLGMEFPLHISRLFKQNLALPLNHYPHPFLIRNDDWSLAKIVFPWTLKQLFTIHFFLASCNFCTVAIAELFSANTRLDY